MGTSQTLGYVMLDARTVTDAQGAIVPGASVTATNEATGVQRAVITDSADMQAKHADLETELIRETCDWLTAPVVEWFQQAVQHAVCVAREGAGDAASRPRAQRNGRARHSAARARTVGGASRRSRAL